MISSIRQAFNSQFTIEKYYAYLDEINSLFPGALEFRIAETPVFVPKEFTRQMTDACEDVIDLIMDPKFKELTDRAIPANVNVPGEDDFCQFITFDFGVCETEQGTLEPQLIEMQGFPTIFAFQAYQPDIVRKHFTFPDNFTAYMGGFEKESYLQLMKEIILGGYNTENVILLEIFPHQQKTRIDFYFTQYFTGIQTVCLTELIQEGNELYYINQGKKMNVKRIYNRIIFDDLQQQSLEVQEKGRLLLSDLNVEWVPHPNWFYRISKFTLPFIRNPFVPQTFFLNEVNQVPADLENYVLKPLFSFAGQGVIIDVTTADIEEVKDPENWILQRKVKYADIIKTPDIPAKLEIRLFYFCKDRASRPVPVNNLARLSKGKMIGVRYNKDKEWVGGTLCFFEK